MSPAASGSQTAVPVPWEDCLAGATHVALHVQDNSEPGVGDAASIRFGMVVLPTLNTADKNGNVQVSCEAPPV